MARQTAMKTTKAIPEIGDLVRVRQRHWVVTAVRPSDALSSASQDTDFSEDPQNLVELISIDEDARAETLSVVWEIEPDASVENPKLPDLRRFDDYATFENFLNAVRWGAVSNINDKLIQSPYRSGITIEDYQLDPVVRAVNMANVSLMIADDVRQWRPGLSFKRCSFDTVLVRFSSCARQAFSSSGKRKCVQSSASTFASLIPPT